jgi:hypothetical protein
MMSLVAVSQLITEHSAMTLRKDLKIILNFEKERRLETKGVKFLGPK